MNIHDLRCAQVQFENEIEDIKEERKNLYKRRDSFTKYFNREKIATMSIDEYVAGKGKPTAGHHNFCYTLERELDSLGSMLGGNAMKLGVYFGKWAGEASEYRFVKRFGDTYQKAFENVKHSLLELIDAGEIEDIEAIKNNPLSRMLKGKILATYFPDKYLNIFAPDHLNYYLIQLNLDTEELIRGDAVLKRKALIEFKNQDPVMKNWNVDLFALFLWSVYPGRPPKEGETTDKDTGPLADYRPLNFPANQSAEFIELNILPPPATKPKPSDKTSATGGKPNYEKETRKLKELGDKGEKIVMDLEKKTLKETGRTDLAQKVTRVSLKSDSFGYDVLSFEVDGTEKYIEVKATRAKTGPAKFFLTINELETAKELKNYFVYIVYGVLLDSPKVWSIRNPFNPENANTIMKPVNFKVTINATTCF